MPFGSSLGRRDFLRSSAALGVGALAQPKSKAPAVIVRGPKPLVVASANGNRGTTKRAYELIVKGTPVVDAVVAGVNLVEDDPNDHSVGLGGLPNERGDVELDASVMDGPSCLSGAVGALRNIKNPSKVALKVMRNSDHCLLVGQGALEFARAQGFVEEPLLTDKARKIWLQWKSRLNGRDAWRTPKTKFSSKDLKRWFGITGTINCNGIDAQGNLGGVTTTSGLAFKIPGRVGDSPIIGAGLFVDNNVGAAGSTGRGEANIITCGSMVVVEAMRQGQHPKDACLAGARRIVEMTKAPHLVDDKGRPAFSVNFYAVDKKGRHGGAGIYTRGSYAICDAQGPRLEDLAGVF